MNSRALLVADSWPEPRECHLVYPDEANCLEDRISVLSPLGVRLLGCHEGETIQVWNGRRAMRVYLAGLTYQPEAAKHWHR
jgi:regulator of nucleoside diphosphate kinase